MLSRPRIWLLDLEAGIIQAFFKGQFLLAIPSGQVGHSRDRLRLAVQISLNDSWLSNFACPNQGVVGCGEWLLCPSHLVPHYDRVIVRLMNHKLAFHVFLVRP